MINEIVSVYNKQHPKKTGHVQLGDNEISKNNHDDYEITNNNKPDKWVIVRYQFSFSLVYFSLNTI